MNGLTIRNVKIKALSQEHLSEIKAFLESKGEEVDLGAFNIVPWEYCNFVTRWRLDGRWRVGASDRAVISFEDFKKLI